MTGQTGHLTLRGVSKSFGATEVVKALDVEVAEGEFLVVLGPSGCGKSTVLRMIAGLEPVTAGEIFIAGRRVDPLPPKDRGCAMVFQNYALYPHLNVRGNIEYGMRIARMGRSERAAKVAEVAALLSIDSLLERKPAALSGGQRQRVAIARAIAREAEVFLFDEPLSNLDAKLRATMRVELRKLHDRIGTTSIFVTHDQVEAMTLADRILILNDGKVAQIGSPDEIYRNPANLFVAGFIGAPPMNLWPVSPGMGDKRARLPNGLEIDLSTPIACPATLGIRPEDIEIADRGPSGSVDHVEDMGAHHLLACDVMGLTVNVLDQRRNRPRWTRGVPIRLSFPPSAIRIFREQPHADG